MKYENEKEKELWANLVNNTDYTKRSLYIGKLVTYYYRDKERSVICKSYKIKYPYLSYSEIESEYGMILYDIILNSKFDIHQDVLFKTYFSTVLNNALKRLSKKQLKVYELIDTIDIEDISIDIDTIDNQIIFNNCLNHEQLKLIQLLNVKNKQEVCNILNISQSQLHDELFKIKTILKSNGVQP